MDIYVSRNGQRTGPFAPFKIREMLDEGELLPDDLAWFEGMDAWEPLRQVEALRDAIPSHLKPSVPPPLPAAADEPVEDRMASIERGLARGGKTATRTFENNAPPIEAAQKAMVASLRGLAWRRSIARITDQILIFIAAWFVAWKLGRLEWWEIMWLPMKHVLLVSGLWIFAEAICTKLFGATPGKLLLGLRVTTADGGPLSWHLAFKRAVLVWLGGLGLASLLGLLIWLLQQVLGYFGFTRNGTTFWDTFSGTTVTPRPVHPAGIAAVVVIPISFGALFSQLMVHAPLSEKMPPEFREQFEQMRAQWKQFEKQIEQGGKGQTAPAVPGAPPTDPGTPPPADPGAPPAPVAPVPADSGTAPAPGTPAAPSDPATPPAAAPPVERTVPPAPGSA